MMKSPLVGSLLLATALIGSRIDRCLAVSYTTLKFPGASSSGINGIDGGNIVGTYSGPGGAKGYLFDGTTWTTLIDPLATQGTFVYGISGTKIVGSYNAGPNATDVHTFVYDGTSYTTLNNPLAAASGIDRVRGISGNNIVGFYNDSNNAKHGYLYNGSTYTTVDDPLAYHDINEGSSVNGISGNKLVGTYNTSNGMTHGFLFDGSTYTTLDDPLGVNGTVPQGISGNLIVGYFVDALSHYHGFLYNGSSFTTLDDPDAVYVQFGNGTSASAVWGNTVVGSYLAHSGGSSLASMGFIAIVPEPSSWVLTAVALAGLLVCGWRRVRLLGGRARHELHVAN